MKRLAKTLAIIALGYLVAAALIPPLRHPIRFVSLLSASLPDPLPVPVRGVSSRALRDSWGAPRSGGRKHEGIDIFARRNTPIVSATDGLVLERGWNDLGGRIVSILGPGGRIFYHAHLERWGPQEAGSFVRRGEIIGYVGTSGNAAGTAPHLHYGVYTLFGRAVNPYTLLRR